MAQSIGSLLDISKIATASLATKQYYAVIADASNDQQVVIAGSNARMLGVLQNKPAAGEVAQIRVARGMTSKVVLGGTVACGDDAQVKSDGTFITATGAAQKVVGSFLQAGVSGDIVEMLILDGYVA